MSVTDSETVAQIERTARTTLIQKVLAALDPIIDPGLIFIRKNAMRLRNWIRVKILGRAPLVEPTDPNVTEITQVEEDRIPVMSEQEFDADDLPEVTIVLPLGVEI